VQPCSESPPQALDASVFTPYMTPIDINLGLYIVSGNLQPGSVKGAGMTGLTGTYTPPAGMNGTEVVSFVAENGCHQTDLGQLTIDVNHSPVGDTRTWNMSAGDDPLILPVGDLASDDEALTITGLSVNSPPWATFNATTVTLAPPPGTHSGDYTFTATVQDPGGLTGIATITITISGTPPNAVDDNYVTADSSITFDPTLNDTDAEPGRLCVQTIQVISPPETTIIPEESKCRTSVTVSPLAHGVSTLSYTIVDRSGLTSSPATIAITSNNPPTIEPASAQTNGQLTAETSVQISDPDGDDLRGACDSGPDYFATLRAPYAQDPNWELEVTVSPEFNDDPSHSVEFTCTVRDAFSSATATMTLSVN
jgi:hypothetical protein